MQQQPPHTHTPECYRLDGGEEKSEISDYNLFITLNPDFNIHNIKIPPVKAGEKWYRVIDTSPKNGEDFLDPGKEVLLKPSDHYIVNPRITVVLLGK